MGNKINWSLVWPEAKKTEQATTCRGPKWKDASLASLSLPDDPHPPVPNFHRNLTASATDSQCRVFDGRYRLTQPDRGRRQLWADPNIGMLSSQDIEYQGGSRQAVLQPQFTTRQSPQKSDNHRRIMGQNTLNAAWCLMALTEDTPLQAGDRSEAGKLILGVHVNIEA